MPRNVPALEAKAAVAELMSHDWKLRLPQKNVLSIAGVRVNLHDAPVASFAGAVIHGIQ